MGLRQAFMALMEWATNVPQKLLQCDAIHWSVHLNFRTAVFKIYLYTGEIVELISKKS